MDVDKKIEYYRKRFPTAGRAAIRLFIIKDYEIERVKRSLISKTEMLTFKRKLDRKLEAHEFEKAFPEPPAKTKKTKTEEETLWEFIKETYPNGVPLYSRTKYHSIRDEEDVLKDAAMLSGTYLQTRDLEKSSPD